MRKSLRLSSSSYHKYHAAAWLSAVVLAAGSYVDEASGCSPLERPVGVYDFGASVPEDDATDVALDSTLAIGLTARDVETSPATPRLVLTDITTGDEVDGEVATFYWDKLHVRFDPDEDLEPEHEYVLRGYSDPDAAALVLAADGGVNSGASQPDIEVSFTTGTHELSKLELSGEVTVVLAPEKRPDYSTCDPGLCDCDPSGEVLGTKAIVTLPGASGAQGDIGYYALVQVTDADGKAFGNASKVIAADPGATVEATRIDDETKDYKPCFTVTVRDLSGQVETTEAVCLDELVPHTGKLDADGGVLPVDTDGGVIADGGSHVYDASPQDTDEPDEPATTDDGNDTGKQPNTDDEPNPADAASDVDTTGDVVVAPVDAKDDDGGCSVATTRGGTNWASLALVGAAIGVAGLRRRRRSV